MKYVYLHIVFHMLKIQNLKITNKGYNMQKENAAKELCQQIANIMRQGKYWQHIMDGNHAYDRMKEFLIGLEATENFTYPIPRMLPFFPGLRHYPVHQPDTHSWQTQLCTHYQLIKDEFNSAVHSDDYMHYKTNSILTNGSWDIYPFFYNGSMFPHVKLRFPKTMQFIETLPRNCFDYPWGNAVFSNLNPGSRIEAHTSIDNLRVRCHLGISVAEGCQIRIAHHLLNWENGKVLFFEDYFEHEVWHDGDEPRVVFIVDSWHPDLTDVEIEALSAAFKKSEIRELIHKTRKTPFADNSDLEQYFIKTFREEDSDFLIQKYWY